MEKPNIENAPATHLATARRDDSAASSTGAPQERVELARLLSLDDVELANTALDAAYVARIRDALLERARAVVGPTLDEPPFTLVRAFIDDFAEMKASVVYLRRSLEGLPQNETRLLAIDPISHMAATAPPAAMRSSTQKAVEIDLVSGFVGAHWHGAEQDESGVWRWSGPAPSSTIVLPALGGGRVRIDLTFDGLTADITADGSILCLVDGSPTALERVASDGYVLDADLGEKTAFDKFVLRLELPRTVSPREIGLSSDPRQLGVRLRRCRVSRGDVAHGAA